MAGFHNAPVEPVLADSTQRLVFVLDLFARDGARPRSLAAAIERKNDLMFGNQTMRLLEFWATFVRRWYDPRDVPQLQGGR